MPLAPSASQYSTAHCHGPSCMLTSIATLETPLRRRSSPGVPGAGPCIGHSGHVHKAVGDLEKGLGKTEATRALPSHVYSVESVPTMP